MKHIEKIIRVIDFESIELHTKWINENRVSRINLRQFPSKLIKFDFANSRFLKPYHIAPLACLIHEYRYKGYKIKLININSKLKDYLDSFKFEQFCSNPKDANLNYSSDSKTLPLWLIDEAGISLYPHQAQSFYENNHFNKKSLFALSISLAELLNNVFDHSESKIPGYTFTQYNSTLHQITTCVCDFGKGIPFKINKYLKSIGEKPLDNQSALEKSFEISFSSKSKPHNRGYGLDNIFTNVKDLHSKLLFISNNVIFWQLPDGRKIRSTMSQFFPGTLILVLIDTNFLPLREEELNDELKLF